MSDAGNEQEAMRDLASNLWNRFLRERVLEELTHEVNAFRAEVVANNGDGTLTVKRPFEDNTLRLRAAASLSLAEQGDQVLILGIGDKRKALSNAFILCKTDLSTFLSEEELLEIEEKLLAAFPTDTASGSPASFQDGADGIQVKDLSVGLPVVQEGSGVASSSNVRHITVWTGTTIYHSGADTSDPEETDILWDSVTGALCGGMLDITSGSLIVTKLLLDASTATYVTATSSYVQVRIAPGVSCNSPISDRFSTETASGTPGRLSMSGGNVYFNVPRGEVPTADTAGVRSWVNTVHPQFAVTLTTPIMYQIPPTQMRTLLGENSIWSDAGDVAVTYRADPTLYIQKKLGA